ncbi:MAG: cation:proton antiporter [Planctomycetota bacterium]
MTPIADALTPTIAAGKFDPVEITTALLALAAMLGLARLLGEIARAFKQPAILGEILAGVILGPTILGAISPESYGFLFPFEPQADGSTSPVAYAIEAAATLSAILLLLIAGLEVELSTVWRQGVRALSVAVVSMAIPFGIGFGAAYGLPGFMGYDPSPLPDGTPAHDVLPFALFIGVALSITALPVIAKILLDLKLAKSEMGTVVISAAMLNDLIGWMGFAVILALIAPATIDGPSDTAAMGVLFTVGLTLLFIGLLLTAGSLVFNRVIPFIQAHGSWPGAMLGFVITMALLGAAYTEYIGIHSIFGAFIVGIAIGNCRHLREKTRHTIHDFIGNIFAPLFFASIGLQVNFVEAFDLQLVIVVMVIAIATKLAGGYLGAKWAGMSQRESGAVAVAMVARGAMEIILGQLALSAGLISEPLFIAIVIMAIVTSLIAGPGIERLLAQNKPKQLRSYLKEKQVVLEMKATDRREAIRELSAVAAEQVGLKYADIDAAVWAREQIVPTGIGDELAVPHARLAGLEKAALILGRSPVGIDFNSPDGEEAQLICLLLTPLKDPTAQIELLGLISTNFADPDTRAAVLRADRYTDLLAALNIKAEEA